MPLSSFAQCVRNLPDLDRVPTTSKLDFDATFGGSLPEETRELLRMATLQRAQLQEALDYGGSKPDPRNVDAAARRYLPTINQIMSSLEAASSTTIKLNSKLTFHWTSSLVAKNKVNAKETSSTYSIGVLVFEMAFVLVSQAIAHGDAARVKLASDATDFAEASTLLRTSSGMLSFVAEKLLPRWKNPPANRPPEVLVPVVKTLALVHLVRAQNLAAAKAVTGGTKPTLVARLLLASAEKYEEAANILRELPKALFENLAESLLDELGTMPVLLKALAFKLLAQSSFEKGGKWGEAVVFSEAASKRMGRLLLGETLKGPLSNCVREETEEIHKLFTEYNEDNMKVYFDPLPSKDEIDIPKATWIAKAVPFELPLGQDGSGNVVSFASSSPPEAAEDTAAVTVPVDGGDQIGEGTAHATPPPIPPGALFGVRIPTDVKLPSVVVDVLAHLREDKSRLQTEGLFRVPGNFESVAKLKSLYDEFSIMSKNNKSAVAVASSSSPGSKLNDANDAAALLKLYLRELPTPVLPDYDAFVTASKRHPMSMTRTAESVIESCRNMLAEKPEHMRLLGELMRFLHEVTNEAEKNKMNAGNLATCFAPTLLRASSDDPSKELATISSVQLGIRVLIENATQLSFLC